jgi:hypothetical protein
MLFHYFVLSAHIRNPFFRSCRITEKENSCLSLSNFMALSLCTLLGVFMLRRLTVFRCRSL